MFSTDFRLDRIDRPCALISPLWGLVYVNRSFEAAEQAAGEVFSRDEFVSRSGTHEPTVRGVHAREWLLVPLPEAFLTVAFAHLPEDGEAITARLVKWIQGAEGICSQWIFAPDDARQVEWLSPNTSRVFKADLQVLQDAGNRVNSHPDDLPRWHGALATASDTGGFFSEQVRLMFPGAGPRTVRAFGRSFRRDHVSVAQAYLVDVTVNPMRFRTASSLVNQQRIAVILDRQEPYENIQRSLQLIGAVDVAYCRPEDASQLMSTRLFDLVLVGERTADRNRRTLHEAQAAARRKQNTADWLLVLGTGGGTALQRELGYAFSLPPQFGTAELSEVLTKLEIARRNQLLSIGN